MKRVIILIILSAFYLVKTDAQSVALKSNALYWGAAVPNLEAEVALNNRFTLDVSVNYNPFSISETKKWKLLSVQPELRYWLCQDFAGHFVGVHALAGEFNVGGVDLGDLKDHRIQGNAVGAGISYGYHWILSPRWGIEATLGLGYIHFKYDKYVCEHCGQKVGSYNKDYYGPTKVGLSLVYLIE